jgi:hypothetical protein
LRHEENVLSELKNLVCASWLASGMVSAVAPDAPLAPDAPVEDPDGTAADPGRIAPLLVTFQPGGSWMLTCPASMVLVVRDDDDFELLPHPAVNARTSATETARRAPAPVFVNRSPTRPPGLEQNARSLAAIMRYRPSRRR